jgi:hypothetical protein
MLRWLRWLFRAWFRSRDDQAKPLPKRRARLGIESMEDRSVPAVFLINSTADVLPQPAGVVTLRSGIQAANATPGNNTILLLEAGTYQLTQSGRNSLTNDGGALTILPTAPVTTGVPNTLTTQNVSTRVG